MFKVSHVAESIQGEHRTVNKDRYGFFSRGETEFLVVMLDGVSSEANAKHGTRMALTLFEREFMKGKISDLRDLVLLANEKLKKSKYEGPYTTACLMYINIEQNPWIQFCSIGDTRGYIITPSNIIQITKDHVSKYAKNVLTHCLGMQNISKDAIFISEKMHGETFLVCTDGFYSIMEKSIPSFHGIFKNTRVNNFSKKLKNILKGNNSDDATYVFVRIGNV